MSHQSFPPQTPIVVDRGREAMDQNLTDELLGSTSRKSWRELTGLVNRLPWGSATKDGLVGPPESMDLLVRGCAAVEDELNRQAAGYSAMRWFWMLRRVPRRVFEGSLSTTRGYDWTLAHVIAARSHRAETHMWSDGILRYPLQGAVYRRLAEFCEGVRCLSDLHRALRWAGKGASFVIRPDENPKEIAGPELRSAVELYDSRRGDDPFAGAGSVVVSMEGAQPPENAILLVRPCAEFEVPISQAAIYADGPVRVRVNFLPRHVGIEALERLTNDAELSGVMPWSNECWVLLALLRMAIVYVFRHKTGLQSLLQNGYLAWKAGSIEPLFDEILRADDLAARCARASSAVSAETLLALLAAGAGQSWPLLAGPVVYMGGGAVCIDLWAATERLDSLLQYPKQQGPTANVRATHFELATQASIDSTKWRPDAQLKAVRGRTLRRGGGKITDVDAIGRDGDTLLLISCKSMIYTAEHDAGDYRAVRNTASDASKAADVWILKRTELMSGPGDNFDFTAFKKVIAVVCTPYPVFVPLGAATDEVEPGLRRVASVNELRSWLAST